MNWSKRIKWVSFLVVFVTSTKAQQESFELLNRDVQFLLESQVASKKTNFHTNIRPYRTAELKQYVDLDSVKIAASLINFGKNDTARKSTPPGFIGIDPLVNFMPGLELSDTLNQGTIFSGIGASVSAGYKPLFLNVNFISENGKYPTYTKKYIQQTGVVSSEGYAFPTKAGSHHKNLNGYLSYRPSQNFNFQLGHGKNFFGDGYRSLLLSDFASNYSYLKITTTVWKLKYVNLFTHLKDVNVPGRRYTDFADKYASLHYLSFNATKWLNISLFESVIWQGKDTLIDRAYDINYLNPIIFYRPVEYSLGSSDNSIIGASFRLKLSNSIQFYGQVVLDEFLLSEVRAGNGWWANKQGAQVGGKWYNVFGLTGLHLQGEVNVVRPYTYSHTSTLQSYGHYNQSLAHPTGANFREAIGFIRYQQWRIQTEAQLTINQFGTNQNGKNYGQDIFISNSNRPGEYGHFIGQGNLNNLIVAQLKFGYRLSFRSNFIAEFGLRQYKHSRFVGDPKQIDFTSNFVWLGIRTALFNNYSDY